MERTFVESSLVASIGYDAVTSVLEIEFHDEDVYRYFDVPEFLYKGFMAFRSKGHFFTSRVTGRFRHEKSRRGRRDPDLVSQEP